MAPRSAALLVLLSALLVAAVQLPTSRVVPQPRCSRHNFVVLKVPSKKKSGTAKGAKKPAGFAKRSAPPKPATALPKGSWDTLRSWLKDRGAKIGGVVAEEVLPGLRGAVATRSFADGDVILSVPQQCILEEQRAEASPVAAVWAGSDVPAYAKVALHVLWLGQTNKWTAVLSMLPTMTDWDAEGGPLQLWSDAEIAAAEDGVLSQRVGRLKKTAEQLYELVEQKWESALGLPPPSLDEFLWAVVTVRSRTFASKAQGGLQAMVVPGVDLCNHDHPENVNTRHDFVGGEFKLVATRDIAVGEEVRLTYGAKPNRQLLMQFGFVLPDPLPMRREVLGDDAAPMVDLLAALPPDVDAASLDALCDDGLLFRTREGGPVSPTQPVGSHLQRACFALKVSYPEVLRRALDDGFSTSAADDEALLNGGEELTPRRRTAVQYRLTQKQLLAEELARSE